MRNRLIAAFAVLSVMVFALAMTGCRLKVASNAANADLYAVNEYDANNYLSYAREETADVLPAPLDENSMKSLENADGAVEDQISEPNGVSRGEKAEAEAAKADPDGNDIADQYSGPEGVVCMFFDAIAEHDMEKYMACFEEDVFGLIMDSARELGISGMIDLLIRDMLRQWDEMLIEEMGEDWRERIQVGSATEIDKEDDTVFYEVEVSIDGEAEVIPVIEHQGKY
mgnify:FL=1